MQKMVCMSILLYEIARYISDNDTDGMGNLYVIVLFR